MVINSFIGTAGAGKFPGFLGTHLGKEDYIM